MTRPCRAAGCAALTTRFGAYCSTHKATSRRHGAPDQRGITKAALKPYTKAVEARIAENQDRVIWRLLDQRWASLVGHSKAAERTTMNGWARRASQEIQRLGASVAPRKIVEAVLALYMMQKFESHRFKSDTAFETQLVRRVRGLTANNARVSHSARGGIARRVYTELPPRVTAIMAKQIIAVLGAAGVWIADNERRTEERKRDDNEQFGMRLAEVTFR